jgi:hypothetical protein
MQAWNINMWVGDRCDAKHPFYSKIQRPGRSSYFHFWDQDHLSMAWAAKTVYLAMIN